MTNATITTILVHTSAADAVLHACQCGWHAIRIDLSTWTPQEREHLSECVSDREGCRLTHSRGWKHAADGAPPSVAPPTPEGLRAWVVDQLSARIAKAAQEAAERAEREASEAAMQAEAAAWAAEASDAELLERPLTGGGSVQAPNRAWVCDDVTRSRVVAALEAKQAEEKEREAAAAAERQALEDADSAAIREWVRQHGSQELKFAEQFGLLSEMEACDEIAKAWGRLFPGWNTTPDWQDGAEAPVLLPKAKQVNARCVAYLLDSFEAVQTAVPPHVGAVKPKVEAYIAEEDDEDGETLYSVVARYQFAPLTWITIKVE